MELVKDKSKRIQWFGAHQGGGPRMGFFKMVQQDGVLMTSRGSALQSSWIGKDVNKEGYWEKREGSGRGGLSKVEEAGTGK